MIFFSCNALKCISMINQEWKIRPQIVNINNNKPIFYSYSIFVNKCKGSCNKIDDPYTKLCVPDVFQNMKSNYLI